MIFTNEFIEKDNMQNQELYNVAKKQLGQLLRETREKIGGSLPQMAFRSELTIDELERVESGEIVSIEYFLIYCNTLDCNVWLALQPLSAANNTKNLINYLHKN